jgi:hypothetical protein
MGRPIVISTKVNREERARIELEAARKGVSLCEWLRQVILQAAPTTPFPETADRA